MGASGGACMEGKVKERERERSLCMPAARTEETDIAERGQRAQVIK